MLRLLSFLTVFYLIFLGATGHAAVWDNDPSHGWLMQVPANEIPNYASVTNNSYTYEDYFSDWIANAVNTGYFANSPLKPADCKQAVYLFRLSFAAMHKLPFVITALNSSNKGTVTLSNNTTMFDDVSVGSDGTARIFAFMEYVQSKVTIETLSLDTYPIRIDDKTLKPGVVLIFMAGGGRNHSLTVQSITGNDITFINGTDEPSNLAQDTPKFLETSIFEHTSHFYLKGRDGFRLWRHREIPISEEKGYNPEQQYSTNFLFYTGPGETSPSIHTWGDAVIFHHNENIDTSDQLKIYLDSIKQKIDNRAMVVLNYEAARIAAGGCLHGSVYSDAETRSADANIRSAFSGLDNFLALRRSSRDNGIGYYENITNTFLNTTTVDYGNDPNDPNRTITLQDFKERMMSGRVSMNPNDSLDRKWGGDGPTNTCGR